jgi:hypothetical protein
MNTMKKPCAHAAGAAAVSIAVMLALPALSAHASSAPMTFAVEKANGSGVIVSYRVEGGSQLGRTASVTLAFEQVSNVNGASVTLSADPGLSIQSEAAFSVPPGKRTEAKVTVLSEREGRFYLNVFVSQGARRSVISVPVQTGTVAPILKSTGTLARDFDGRLIISMPAK